MLIGLLNIFFSYIADDCYLMVSIVLDRLDIQSRKEEVIDELENLKMNSKIFMTEITSTIQQRRAEYQKLSDEVSVQFKLQLFSNCINFYTFFYLGVNLFILSQFFFSNEVVLVQWTPILFFQAF